MADRSGRMRTWTPVPNRSSGGPIFALAWNVDEDYLFHNGLSREEVSLGAVGGSACRVAVMRRRCVYARAQKQRRIEYERQRAKQLREAGQDLREAGPNLREAWPQEIQRFGGAHWPTPAHPPACTAREAP